jgi:hypothetical protein
MFPCRFFVFPKWSSDNRELARRSAQRIERRQFNVQRDKRRFLSAPGEDEKQAGNALQVETRLIVRLCTPQ